MSFCLKTLVLSIRSSLCLKTLVLSIRIDALKPWYCRSEVRFCLKTLVLSIRIEPLPIRKEAPEEEEEEQQPHIWPNEPPALGITSPLARPRSFASPARSHARRERETKPKPISRSGISRADYFPQPQIFVVPFFFLLLLFFKQSL